MEKQVSEFIKKKKQLGIISYNMPHVKTEQIVFNLFDRYDMRVYALPYVPRNTRKVWFPHRPNQLAAAHPKELCRHYQIPFISVQKDTEIDNDCDFYLIAGAGILSAEFLNGKQVINAHPGVIPAVRGLDSFKWSIYNMLPLGITLHYIDKDVDAGDIISIIKTPVFLSDSLESLARCHYEQEIKILSEFEQNMRDPKNHFTEIPQREPTRRMKYEQELELTDKFKLYKMKYCN